MVGGETVNVSFAAAALEPPLDARAPDAIVFNQDPGVLLVTLTVTVQEPLAGMVAPDN